jgi:hypothetical protein
MTDRDLDRENVAQRIVAEAAEKLRAHGVCGLATWREMYCAIDNAMAADLGAGSLQHRVEVEAARDHLETLLATWGDESWVDDPPSPEPRFQLLIFGGPEVPPPRGGV